MAATFTSLYDILTILCITLRSHCCICLWTFPPTTSVHGLLFFGVLLLPLLAKSYKICCWNTRVCPFSGKLCTWHLPCIRVSSELLFIINIILRAACLMLTNFSKQNKKTKTKLWLGMQRKTHLKVLSKFQSLPINTRLPDTFIPYSDMLWHTQIMYYVTYEGGRCEEGNFMENVATHVLFWYLSTRVHSASTTTSR